MTRSTPVIAVIGAGFSGLMTALNLVRDAAGREAKVILIERQSQAGLGVAYATTDPSHHLNVRAKTMSGWPDRPDDFVAWLKTRKIAVGPDGFAKRSDYGNYLQSLLSWQVGKPGAAGRLTVVHDEITAVEKTGDDGWVMTCASGPPVTADAVILALGNPAPHTPAAIDPELARSRAYIANPWEWDLGDLAGGRAPVMMIGTGLTMVDMALSLARVAPERPLIALSRRGFTPRDHDGAAVSRLPGPPPASSSPMETLTWLRGAAVRHGWRTAVDAVRPIVRDLWQGWSLKQQASFLRHARVVWDVHRHRLAPEVAARFASLRADGSLRILAGKLERVGQCLGGGIEVVWRPRGKGDVQSFTTDRVVNCTGPCLDVEHSAEPLITAMARQGLIRAGPLRLGLEIDDEHRVIGADGARHATLFAVGPMTQGGLWEINAVPEIRCQAAQVADAVLRTQAKSALA